MGQHTWGWQSRRGGPTQKGASAIHSIITPRNLADYLLYVMSFPNLDAVCAAPNFTHFVERVGRVTGRARVTYIFTS